MKLDDGIVKLLAETLYGLQIPSAAKHYHLSTAYEPYLALMKELGLYTAKRPTVEQVLAALKEKLLIALPTPSAVAATNKATTYYYDEEWGC